MRHVETIAGAFVLLSGAYLLWYFWVVDIREESDPITGAVEQVQIQAQNFLDDHWHTVGIVLVLIVGAAIVASVLGRRHQPPHADPPGPA